MAHSPAKTSERSLTKTEERIIDLLTGGMSVAAVAKKLQPDDKRKRHNLRRAIWHRVRSVPSFQQQLASAAKARALQEGVSAVPAVGRRARRGRVDAFRALNEFSGLHNPKVQHEHTGDIKVTLITIPRPAAIGTGDEDIVDGTVVEDT